MFDFHVSFEFKIYVKRNAVGLAFGLNIEKDLCFKVLPLGTRTILCQKSLYMTKDEIFLFVGKSTNFYSLKPLR